MKLKITVDGKVYEVEVEVAEAEPSRAGHVPAAPTSNPALKPGTPAPPQPISPVVTDESKVCRSPISGVVVRVSAQVGQTIQVGDMLLVLEAMKMETVITSAVAGKVARVNAGVGDAVQGGQAVVEFE